MMETNAVAFSTRGGGRWSNFSISTNSMSTCERPVLARLASNSGKRCKVCGPNTTSTYGARETIFLPSCEATQPPTPMIKSGLCFLISRMRPRSENTFSWAFSRIEQVLSSTTSASLMSSVLLKPLCSRSTSWILSVSYSFI